jgi:hypothetical protein
MNMTNLCLHASSERLTLYFYGELSAEERRVLEEHVSGCATCSAVLDDLRGIRSALLPRGQVSRTRADWDAFMARLLPKLDAPHPSRWATTEFRPDRISGWRAVGIAAALVLAVGSGLMWQRSALGPPSAAMAQGGAGDAALAAAAERHFERAKLVVLGIAMKDPSQTSPADWQYERQLAASLLPETRLFRLSAADRGDVRLAGLLGDLESVLLQASMSTDAEPSELERLQRVIRRRDLLVRMDLREL